MIHNDVVPESWFFHIHSVRELGLRLVTNSILQDLDAFVMIVSENGMKKKHA